MKHQARKRFGQHFLVDQGIIDAIVQAIHPEDDQCLIEIGPGPGALTQSVLQRIERLAAVEIDRDLYASLQRRYPASRLDLVLGDALTVDFRQWLAPGRWPQVSKFRLIGNLPYNISSPLLLRLAEFADDIQDMHFMLQKEVVQRICAQAGHSEFGRLTVILAAHFDAQYLFEVPPEAFDPPPRVDSAVLRMEPKPIEQRITGEVLTALELLLAQAFAQKRKMLRKTLLPWLDERGVGSSHIEGTARAEDLPCEVYFELAKKLAERASA